MQIKKICKDCRAVRFSNIKPVLIMKLMMVFLLAASLQSFTAHDQRLSISVKNAELEEVFENIQRQSGYQFIFNSQLMKQSRKVSLSVQNAELEDVLEKCFEDQPFSYQIMNETIVVKPLRDAKAGQEEETAPPTPIKGVVKDEGGLPLSGVSVTIKGSKKGTQTDDNGAFSLIADDDNVTLVISSVGYEPLEIKASAKREVAIALRPLSGELEGVVVNALGFKEKADKQGSSSAKIEPVSVLKSGETGLIQAMAGKAAGVTITRSNGDPGASATIRIRGANTISGASQPLIIVDGIPVSNSQIQGFGSSAFGTGVAQQSRLNDINPNDIESIQILKGTAAAALWGSRAANGVVVITTKKGKSGAMKVNFTSTYSMDKINRRHPIQSSYGQGSNGVYNPAAANSWGDKIADRSGGEDVVDLDGAYFEGYATGKRYYRILQRNSQETYADKNFDGVFGTGNFFQNALNMSGGNEKAKYFFSLENMDQNGIIRANSDYHRRSVRINSDFAPSKYLKISNKVTYMNIASKRVQQNSNVAGLYLGLLRTPTDFDGTDYKGSYYTAAGVETRNRHRSYRRYLGDNINPVYNNPYWTIFDQNSTSNVNRYLVSTELTSSPTRWLDIILRGGVDANYDSREYVFPVGSAGELSTGSFRQEKVSEVEKNLDLIGRATTSLSDDINAVFTVGGNINHRRIEDLYGLATNFLDNINMQNFIISSNPNTTVRNDLVQIGSNRGYATASFDYKDFLFLNLSGAQEVASTISGSFFYPSVDAAWQFSKLPLFENSNILSFGKLRAAWGKVGVQPAAYRFFTVYELPSFNADDPTGYDPLGVANFGGGFRYSGSKGNANLRPEIKTEWEVGTDMRFFNNKLSLGLSYYQNQTKDILLNVGLAPSGGYTSQYTNGATIENKGLEIDARYNIINRKDFNVEVFANFNRNRNKVLSLNGASSVDLTGSGDSRAVVGYPVGVLWGSRAQRDEKGDFALDANGFPLLDNSQGVIGDPNPDWRGAVGLSVSYKGFDVNVMFETFQGGDISEGTRAVLYNFGTHEDVSKEITLTEELKNVNGVVFPVGSTVRGNVENFGAGNVLLDERWYTTRGAGVGSSVIREFFIGDASWTRLREVSLGYTFTPKKLAEKTGIKSLRLSATGRNLFLWTSIVGFDPEINRTGVGNGFGVEYFTNPSTRSFLVSLNVNF